MLYIAKISTSSFDMSIVRRLDLLNRRLINALYYFNILLKMWTNETAISVQKLLILVELFWFFETKRKQIFHWLKENMNAKRKKYFWKLGKDLEKHLVSTDFTDIFVDDFFFFLQEFQYEKALESHEALHSGPEIFQAAQETMAFRQADRALTAMESKHKKSNKHMTPPKAAASGGASAAAATAAGNTPKSATKQKRSCKCWWFVTSFVLLTFFMWRTFSNWRNILENFRVI